MGAGRRAVHPRLRGRRRVPGPADGQDAADQADADRVAVGRQHPRPGRRRQARPRPAGWTGDDRRGRGQLRRRSPLPDLRRRPRHRRGGVGRAGPQRRHPAGVLRRAHRRAEGLDHRRSRSTCPPATRRRSPTRSRTRRSLRPVPRGPARRQGGRPGPPRRVQPARPLEHRRGEVDQGRALQPAQGHRQPDRRSSCSSSPRSCSPTSAMYRAFLLLGELRYLYRLPKDEAVERLDAWLAWASRSRAQAVRQARPHHPQSTSRACSPRFSWTSATDASKRSTAASG